MRGHDGEAYNIGVETPEIAVAELAQMLVRHGKDILGYRGKVVLQKSQDATYLVDSPNRRCPIIE